MAFQGYNKELSKKHYDLFYQSADFRSFSRADRSFVAALAAKYHIKPGCRLLDMPCGTGKYTAYFSELGIKALGADLSSTAISFARESYPEIQFVEGDAFELHFESLFDAIFCHGFSPFNEPDLRVLLPFMDRMRQNLKRDGIFIFGKTSALTDKPSPTKSRIDHSIQTFETFFGQAEGFEIIGKHAVIPHIFPVLRSIGLCKPITASFMLASKATKKPVRVYFILKKV